MSEPRPDSVGVVAIGRNEGERLYRCLKSVKDGARRIVYVDSGSTDDSAPMARALGVEVVELDLSVPFTAARARNAGIARLCELEPDLEFVQVVDGDCEIAAGWIARAFDEMNRAPKAAIICGRRCERQPGASVYNKLCDMEWNTPVGEAQASGGDALIRLEAFRQAGGYDENIIAGEEPELCQRLRLVGWSIQRIDYEMTLHDAAMTRFGQWWRRTVRSGHASAEGHALHGRHGLGVRTVRSTLEWTVLLPLLALGLAWFTWGTSLLLFAAYFILWWRVRRHRLERGDSARDASLYAQYCVLGKFAELVGMMQYWWNHLRGRQTRLIEYKTPGASRPLSAAQPPRAPQSADRLHDAAPLTHKAQPMETTRT